MKAERTREVWPVLFCVRCAEARHARQPAEQAQARKAERHREPDLPARGQESRASQRANAAARLQHVGTSILRIDAGEAVQRPDQHEQQRADAEKQRRHRSAHLLEQLLRAAAAGARTDPTSAFMPPAA